MAQKNNREIRRIILKACEYSYPHGAGEQLIELSLNQVKLYVSPGELQKNLTYLEQKGYITREHVTAEGTGISRHLAHLTAKGVDLLDGSIPRDPGIELDYE